MPQSWQGEPLDLGEPFWTNEPILSWRVLDLQHMNRSMASDAVHLHDGMWLFIGDHSRIPVPECSCGYYSWKSPLDAFGHWWNLMRLGQNPTTFTLAQVELTGRVIEHEWGYRSQRMRLVRVGNPPGPRGLPVWRLRMSAYSWGLVSPRYEGRFDEPFRPLITTNGDWQRWLFVPEDMMELPTTDTPLDITSAPFIEARRYRCVGSHYESRTGIRINAYIDEQWVIDEWSQSDKDELANLLR